MNHHKQSVWPRLAPLQPKLRSHVTVHRHEYRNKFFYVLEDKVTGRHFRFSPAAYFFIGLMDGRRSVDGIWQKAQKHFQSKCPSQEEFVRLLGTLSSADMLDSQTMPNLTKLLERQQRQQKKQHWKKRFANPLSLRFPLADPDRHLSRYLPRLQFCFSPLGGWILALSLFCASLLLLVHWPEFSAQAKTVALTPDNILLMWLVYPFIKLLHELGHAFAVKRWGGEVHEMGIMLLVFTPVPYVDASSASAFRDKQQRIIVGAAGIGVELFIASWALFVWLATNPGFLNDLAFSIMLLTGFSTLLFNGNPLLRYDGYYILTDAIGIPNLASRAKKYFGYLVQHYLYGIDLPTPSITSSERNWFVFYAVASWFYRLALLAFIIIYLIQSFFVIGLLLAIWAIGFQIIFPAYRYLRFIMSSPVIRPGRQRALSIVGGSISFLLTFILFVPIPFSTVTEGIISLPEETQLRSKIDGVVRKVAFSNNQFVQHDSTIAELDAPELQSRADILEARYRELSAELSAHWSSDRVQADIIRDKLKSLEQERQRLHEQIRSLSITSPASGTLILPLEQDLIGQYIRKGTLLGYISNGAALQVKTVVSQEDAALLKKIHEVTARVAGQTDRRFKAEVERITPEASQYLPSPALSDQGGGNILTETDDRSGVLARQKYFQIELSLALPPQQVFIGQRVYLKFDHGTATLAAQGYRLLRQFFLQQLQA